MNELFSFDIYRHISRTLLFVHEALFTIFLNKS
nr:MAG TPA: hypothetical protein [Caudoviricetes sp.]